MVVVDFLIKSIYGALGAPYPRLSLAVVMIMGAFCFGGFWLILGHQWQQNLPPGPAVQIANLLSNARVEVHDLFVPIYIQHGGELGQPTGPLTVFKTGELYQGGHEHAIVIWTYFNRQFYRLGLDGENTSRWTSRPDPEFSESNKPEWRTDSALRFKFNPPFESSPPFAGIALRWSLDPSGWAWIGWRKWHWSFESSGVLPAYQEFEHGLVIGGLSFAPGSDPQVFVLIKEHPLGGRWDSRTLVGVAPPKLREPI
jgi:hypothetical protein